MAQKLPRSMGSGFGNTHGLAGQRSLFDTRPHPDEPSRPGVQPPDTSMALLSGGWPQKRVGSTVACIFTDLSGICRLALYPDQPVETIKV